MDLLPTILIFAAIGFVIYKKTQGNAKGRDLDSARKHCLTCGLEISPDKLAKGHGSIELILWLCFLVPGLIYSIWRRTNMTECCTVCRATNIVPINSPAAVAHRKAIETVA